MSISVYRRGDSHHVRDTEGNHWTVRISSGGTVHHRSERRRRAGGSGAFTRFAPHGQGVSLLGLGHGVMNFLTQEGSWAWYTGRGGEKRRTGRVEHTYVPTRTQGTSMANATNAELGKSLSATGYAREGHGAYWTRGHSAIRYEWCHLVAHGMGGSDEQDNLVAATRHQNTEQFILECVLYGYRMEGFTVDVAAKLAKGTDHLAESIHYQVLLGGRSAYRRTMDCRRATQPSWPEFRSVARDMRAWLNAALAEAYPSDLSPEESEYIDEELPDESADFFERYGC